MGAQMIIPQAQADEGFSLLKDIVAMIKNPDAIDEAYQRRLDAAKLTDDEVAKADAARDLIAQGDELKAALDQKADALAADRSVHENNVNQFENYKQTETARLTEWASQLETAAVAHTETEKKNQIDAKSNDERAAQIEADANARQQELDAQALAQSGVAEAQKAEDARLAAWRDQLKDKAAKLAALAQSDG